jgi:hypothetical protein
LEVVGPAARHRLIRNLKFGAISLGAEARICERAQAIFLYKSHGRLTRKRESHYRWITRDYLDVS